MSGAESYLDPKIWMADAPCKGVPHIFFGRGSERPQRRVDREAQAREVCMGCAVLDICRDYAHNTAVDGMWAGENETDRLLSDPQVPLTQYTLTILKRDKNPAVVAAFQARNSKP